MPDHLVQVRMDAPARFVDGRTMLPARWVAQEPGLQIQGNGGTRHVTIAGQ